MSDRELFQKIATIFNIKYYEEGSGNLVAEIEDTMFMYNEHKKILQKRIENKMELQKVYEIDVVPLQGKERFLMLEDLYRTRQELLDLEIEYISKNDYIANYQGHIERSRISYQQSIVEAKKNLPALIDEVKEFLNTKQDLFAAKINAQLYGLVMRSDAATTEKEMADCYRDLKIIFYYAQKEK